MRLIEFHGGAVRFRLPQSWVSETDPDGSGVYYDPAGDSSTLRLSLISFRIPAGSTHTLVHQFANTAAKYGVQAECLAGEHHFVSYSLAIAEDGERLKQRYWELGTMTGADTGALAVFSLTALHDDYVSPHGQELQRLLDAEIRHAQLQRVAP